MKMSVQRREHSLVDLPDTIGHASSRKDNRISVPLIASGLYLTMSKPAAQTAGCREIGVASAEISPAPSIRQNAEVADMPCGASQVRSGRSERRPSNHRSKSDGSTDAPSISPDMIRPKIGRS